jgi:hypothetical protein
MKNLVNFLFIAATALLLFACKKSTIPTYSGMEAIYFSNSSDTSRIYDSSKITFAYDVLSKKDSTIRVRVYTTGQVKDYDREFKLTLIDSITTAVKDVNYSLVTNKLVIKAGTAFTYISFKLYRTPEMVSKTYLINLLLEPNENFTTDYYWDWYNLTLKRGKSLLLYTITFDDIFSQPRNWFVDNFGKFTRTKLNMLNAFFEIDMPQWNIQSGGTISATTWSVFAKVFQRYLNDEKAAGRTVYDEDGSEMTMGKNAQ